MPVDRPEHQFDGKDTDHNKYEEESVVGSVPGIDRVVGTRIKKEDDVDEVERRHLSHLSLRAR